MGHNNLSLCQNGNIFISGVKKYNCSVCVIVHMNSQITKPFIIHLMHKEITFLKNHIMFSIDISSIFLNAITMKWRKVCNRGQEPSFVFIAFLHHGRLWDCRSTVSVLVNAAWDPGALALLAHLAMYLCNIILWISIAGIFYTYKFPELRVYLFKSYTKDIISLWQWHFHLYWMETCAFICASGISEGPRIPAVC